jgi:hypothetical protein
MGVNVHSAAITSACEKLERANSIVDSLDSVCKCRKWLDKNNHLVMPSHVTIGSREVQRFSSTRKAFCSALEADMGQLNFSDKLLGKLLDNALFNWAWNLRIPLIMMTS